MQIDGGRAWSMHAEELKPALALALALEHAQMGILVLRDELSGELYPATAVGLTPEQCAEFGLQRPGVRPFGLAFSEHRRVTIPDVSHDGADGLQDVARWIGFRGLDVFPLSIDHGPALGAMGMLFRRPREPSQRAARLVELCAHTLASALESSRLRAQAERARTHIEEASRAKLHFLARISHELRTPLQSIAGYVDLLKLGIRGRVTSGQADYLKRIERSQQILLSVIDDLITFSRLEVGRVDYHIHPVSVTEALTEAEMIVAPLMRERHLLFDVGTTPADWVVRGDAEKVRQILVNLLANALKFTPAGGTIRLACETDGRWVLFRVSDTGPGIPPDKLQEIFQPYVQLELTSLDGLGGSGLGLAISREFACGMGGELLVSSTPGSGSTFTLKLQRVMTTDRRAELAARVGGEDDLRRRTA